MRNRLAALAFGVALLASTGTANAALTVANTNDSGPGSLRQTVAEAPPGETVNLPAGTYTLTSGQLVLPKAVTISGAGAADTTIRAGGAFRVIESAMAAALNDLTIRDGIVFSAGGGGINFGAGIRASGPLFLQRVIVAANKAISDGEAGKAGGIAQGGGIFAAKLTMVESSVLENVASANGGTEKAGAISQGGGIFVVGSMSISSSTIAGNVATSRGGAGPSNPAQNGGVSQGGGLFAVQNEVSASISGSTISGNSVDVSAGPGGKSGTGQGGGGFESANNSSMSIANSTFASNRGVEAGAAGIIQGGGLFANGTKPGVAISSTTLSGNRIESDGGTSEGGNLFAPAEGSLQNTIVTGGVGAAGSENCIASEKFVSLGFNLDSRNQCGFTAPGDLVNRDPLLGPLQGNGGPTQTLLPAVDSPAVDQGRGFGLITDQRGLARPVELPTAPNSTAPGADGADIGAVEVQLPPPVTQQLSNDFKLTKVTKNRKKGTARILVLLPKPSAGVLTLTGKTVRKQTVTIAGQDQVSLSIAGNAKVRKALRKRGRRKVKFEVTYAPTGTQAATKSRTVKLVKKKKKAPTR